MTLTDNTLFPQTPRTILIRLRTVDEVDCAGLDGAKHNVGSAVHGPHEDMEMRFLPGIPPRRVAEYAIPSSPPSNTQPHLEIDRTCLPPQTRPQSPLPDRPLSPPDPPGPGVLHSTITLLDDDDDLPALEGFDMETPPPSGAPLHPQTAFTQTVRTPHANPPPPYCMSRCCNFQRLYLSLTQTDRPRPYLTPS